MKRITVKYAPPIDDALLERIRLGFAERLGEEVALDAIADPSLLGGFRIYADGKLFDASLRRRLDELTADLLAGSTGSDKR